MMINDCFAFLINLYVYHTISLNYQMLFGNVFIYFHRLFYFSPLFYLYWRRLYLIGGVLWILTCLVKVFLFAHAWWSRWINSVIIFILRLENHQLHRYISHQYIEHSEWICFFIAVDLKNTIKGIDIWSEIRSLNSKCFILFNRSNCSWKKHDYF